MKRILLAGAVGLAFIGATAQLSFAQPYSDGRGDSAQYGPPPDRGPPPGDRDSRPDWRWRHEQRGRYSQNGPNEYGPPGRGPGGPPPPPHGPPPANAAHFVFQRGPARIDITCPQVFALQDCIQAATQLLDKIRSLRAGAPHPGASDAPARSGGGASQQAAPSDTTRPQVAPPNAGEEKRM